MKEEEKFETPMLSMGITGKILEKIKEKCWDDSGKGDLIITFKEIKDIFDKEERLKTKVMKAVRKATRCNINGCEKLATIETDVGRFCSEKCRKQIEKNIFKALIT